jgi:hypothetical protein
MISIETHKEAHRRNERYDVAFNCPCVQAFHEVFSTRALRFGGTVNAAQLVDFHEAFGDFAKRRGTPLY